MTIKKIAYYTIAHVYVYGLQNSSETISMVNHMTYILKYTRIYDILKQLDNVQKRHFSILINVKIL